MNRDELQGIIAHETSHIVNGDSRLNTSLIGILFGICGTSLLGRNMMKMGGTGTHAVIVGVVLCAIGSIGLFFGRLIQSAVSREREYLADAAAVQFTRNSAGLISALNKLRVSGSQIQNPQALAASHLFFGASEKPSRLWSTLFATHPPLEERIQRLGGEALPLPEGVIHAQTLLATLPETLRQAAQNGTGAKGIVCGLFISNMRPHVWLPPDVRSVAEELYLWLSTQPEQGAQYRLVWLDLALPALREASRREREKLLGWIEDLIPENERANPSECALYSILKNTLLSPAEHNSLNREPLYRLVAKVLALIAYAGHEDVEMAKAAYQAAMAHSPARKEVPFPDREAWSLPAFSQTFLCLAQAAPLYRKKFLEACAVAAQHDGKITPVENELLRAFAQALDCPAPLV
jgi:hypothetical protein